MFPFAGQRIIAAQARNSKVDARVSAKPRSRREHVATMEGFLLLLIFLLILENSYSQEVARSLHVLDEPGNIIRYLESRRINYLPRNLFINVFVKMSTNIFQKV